jgi:hypothetical protein
MTTRTGLLALATVLTVVMPMTAGAQDKGRQGGAAPAAAAPARSAAPAAAAAPQMSAPRMAPQMSAPRMATPQVAPSSQAATPRFTPQKTVTPHYQSPAVVNRSALQSQAREDRALRHKHAQSSAQARTTAQAHTKADVKARTNLQAQAKAQIDTKQPQQRAERALRRAEDRELRRLAPSQRAQRREQIQQARQQRTQTSKQLAQPNVLQGQTKAQTLRATRRNGTARVTADAAKQGRFAAKFAQQAGAITARSSSFASDPARRAWRHHHHAFFVAWFGPLFWPYAYSDIFDYTFWPYGYDDGYWAYAYDDFFGGLFWGEAGPPVEYAYAAAPSVQRPAYASAQRPAYASVQELCRQPGSGVTAWPFAEIERKVGLSGDQRQLLGDVRKASEDAAAAFKASCPSENAFPLTPPGRLSAMTARLEATLQAVQTVRPPLERFYASLSDEQKERFNLLGPKNTAENAQAREASEAANTCKQPKQGLSNLPIEKIEDVVNPTDAQEAKLNRLQEATNKAVSIMQAACPDDIPVTPTGRLDAMEQRLQAMIGAANAVKPALENFYASLTNEQKARFNRLGQQLSRVNG